MRKSSISYAHHMTVVFNRWSIRRKLVFFPIGPSSAPLHSTRHFVFKATVKIFKAPQSNLTLKITQKIPAGSHHIFCGIPSLI